MRPTKTELKVLNVKFKLKLFTKLIISFWREEKKVRKRFVVVTYTQYEISNGRPSSIEQPKMRKRGGRNL